MAVGSIVESIGIYSPLSTCWSWFRSRCHIEIIVFDLFLLSPQTLTRSLGRACNSHPSSRTLAIQSRLKTQHTFQESQKG